MKGCDESIKRLRVAGIHSFIHSHAAAHLPFEIHSLSTSFKVLDLLAKSSGDEQAK